MAGCGCGGNKIQLSGTPGVIAAPVQALQYQVYNESGALVASYSNPVTARAEARRIGGTVTEPTTSASPAGITTTSNESEGALT